MRQVRVCVIGVRRMAKSVAGVASEFVTCVGQVRVCVCHRGEEDGQKCSGIASKFVTCVGQVCVS